MSIIMVIGCLTCANNNKLFIIHLLLVYMVKTKFTCMTFSKKYILKIQEIYAIRFFGIFIFHLCVHIKCQ